MTTTQELLDSLKQDKQNLVSMLNSMGVEASNNETFTSLTPKVGEIVTDPILQDKSVEITSNGTTNIVADENYDGLNKVEITTNISTEAQENGLLIKEYDSDGYPTSVELKDMTINIEPTALFGLPTAVSSPQSNLCIFLRRLKKVVFKNVNFAKGMAYMCQYSPLEEVFFDNCTFPSEVNGIYTFSNSKQLKKIKATNFPTQISNYYCMNASELLEVYLDNVTSIGQNAFLGCSKLPLDKLPDTLTSMGLNCFANCSALIIKTIPDGITALPTGALQATSITQISMLNVASIGGNLSANGCFYNNKKLKAVWIGSKLTSIGQYTFSGATLLTKIFIDLPRATVEAMNNYGIKWNATNATIICNDDDGFITKEQFDNIDWSTYTG